MKRASTTAIVKGLREHFDDVLGTQAGKKMRTRWFREDLKELARRARLGDAREKRATWNFWLPDSDATCGWTNHGYILQFVCCGDGRTPEEAWADAKRRGNVPEGFELPESLVAIREDDEHPVEGT